VFVGGGTWVAVLVGALVWVDVGGFFVGVLVLVGVGDLYGMGVSDGMGVSVSVGVVEGVSVGVKEAVLVGWGVSVGMMV
jgi:hypothetical protein